MVAAFLGDPAGPQAGFWLTDRAILPPRDGREQRPTSARVLPLGSGTRLAGAETQLLVYDAWSGLDPDGFGAATGALRGGGLLLILAPPLSAWCEISDPQAQRIAVWPHDAATLTRRFQRRFVQVLIGHPGVTLVREGEPIPAPPSPNAAPLMPGLGEQDPTRPATPDQQGAIAAILRLAHGRAHRPLVLTAHRGRGKSAALGIAAARLARDGLPRILVTAPRSSACATLFHHFALTLGAVAPPPEDPDPPTGALRFIAPDELCETRPAADLLLVDEAAGIPAPLLANLLDHYPRVCFATTVHGYEGTGRGFEVRFRELLDRRTPGWRALSLTNPIRWSAGDPLEALVSRALLLDASPAPGLPSPAETPEDAELVRLDRDALVADESTLRQVFGLLVLAHYQTRPMDLRMLLDGPNVRIYCLRRGSQVLATLLAAEEGAMASAELRHAIFTGRRRPRGHLLPQTLSAHGGLLEAPALGYLRVIRIAVHPAHTRQGLGARLLRRLAVEGRRAGCDLTGASFGATPGLLAFWQACGFRPAHMGTSRNAASGEHAVVMLRPLSPAGRRLAARAERRLEERLGVLLAGPLRRLDPLVAAALVSALQAEGPGAVEGFGKPSGEASSEDPGEDPGPEIDSFVLGHRTLEAALPVLSELTRRGLGPALRKGRLSLPEGALLIAALRQLRPIGELVGLAAAPGREALIARLRALVGRLAND